MSIIDNVKVSIVVPIYNVEQYVEKCVKSIIDQDYVNVEIILVDDGSTDLSGYLIDRYAVLDQRIIVIHQKNMGVSAARNKGLESATGDYVTFVDGDDWIDPNYVSYFLHILKKNKCQIAMNINNYTAISDKSSGKDYLMNSEKVIEMLYLGDIFVAVWNKMYDLNFLNNHSIRFDEEIWYGEGMLFNILCLQHIDKVAIGESSVYHQVSNPNSAMRKFNLNSNYCGIKSLELQKKCWKKTSVKISEAWEFHRYAFNWTIMAGLSRTNQENIYKDEYDCCAQRLRRDVFKALRVNISLRNKIMYIAIALFPYFMAKREKRKVRY